jgi:hypothetical protein
VDPMEHFLDKIWAWNSRVTETVRGHAGGLSSCRTARRRVEEVLVQAEAGGTAGRVVFHLVLCEDAVAVGVGRGCGLASVLPLSAGERAMFPHHEVYPVVSGLIGNATWSRESGRYTGGPRQGWLKSAGCPVLLFLSDDARAAALGILRNLPGTTLFSCPPPTAGKAFQGPNLSAVVSVTPCVRQALRPWLAPTSSTGDRCVFSRLPRGISLARWEPNSGRNAMTSLRNGRSA